jgi:hypothetical protein
MMYVFIKFNIWVFFVLHHFHFGVSRVVQWLQLRRKDLMILASRLRIALWDVGVGLLDEAE